MLAEGFPAFDHFAFLLPVQKEGGPELTVKLIKDTYHNKHSFHVRHLWLWKRNTKNLVELDVPRLRDHLNFISATRKELVM